MKKRIAVLLHEKDRNRDLNCYLVTLLAEFWRETGFEVVFVFGVKTFIPADLVLVHVDLSVVPARYLEFACRYPIVLNGQVKDIRKSSFSRILLRPGDSYDGKVIVKSDLNYGGLPEWKYRRRGLFARLFGVSPEPFQLPTDYRIYDRLDEVPPADFESSETVVEKFLPETENDLYFVHDFEFLGDKLFCLRVASRNPIVKFGNRVSAERVEPHPEIVELRHELKFDYGKFDYVVRDGRAVLLDTNKTIGGGPIPKDIEDILRLQASGINAYFR